MMQNAHRPIHFQFHPANKQIMPITLTKEQILSALPLVARGLQKYLWIQSQVALGPGRITDRYFQRKFNGFYRIRRAPEWQSAYYKLLASKLSTGIEFRDALKFMLETTGRIEASFMSKLVATINPSKPVIDSVVLENIGLALPKAKALDRIEQICNIHATLEAGFHAFLATEPGRFLVESFRKNYPEADITEVKMLDLVLWQIRPRSPMVD
ncbi:conserved protein of unknown function [Burkholderia multivorans]